MIIGSFGKVSDSQTIQVSHKLIPKNQEGSNQLIAKEIDLTKENHDKSDFFVKKYQFCRCSRN